MKKLDTFCAQICIFQVSLKISQTFLIVLAEAGDSARAKQFLRKLLSMPLLPLTTGKKMVLRYGATFRTKSDALPPLQPPPRLGWLVVSPQRFWISRVPAAKRTGTEIFSTFTIKVRSWWWCIMDCGDNDQFCKEPMTRFGVGLIMQGLLTHFSCFWLGTTSRTKSSVFF